MNKATKLLLIPLILLSCAKKEDDGSFRIDKKAERVYANVSYDEGIASIAKLAKSEKEEDVWFFNGLTWYDVGYVPQNGAYSQVDSELLTDLLDYSDSTKQKLVHSHVSYDGEAFGNLLFHPPSINDLSGQYVRKQALNLKDKQEMVVDEGGVWTYFWSEPPAFHEQISSPLTAYAENRLHFMNMQRKHGSKFKFAEEYFKLTTEAEKLGMSISYMPFEK